MKAQYHDAVFTLPFPAQPGYRIAALEQAWSRYQGVNFFGPQHWQELRTFEPDILVASSSALKRLSEEKHMPEVGCAIFVMLPLGASPLREEDRDLFWNTFEVPVWELLIAPSGEVLGHECERHEGWHLIRATSAVHEHYEGYFNESPCPCGRPSPGFIVLREKPLVKTVTASANQ